MIAPDDPSDYEQLFVNVTHPDRAPLAGVIHLWSLRQGAAQPDATTVERSTMLAAESSLRLIQRLVRFTGQRDDFSASWRGLWFATRGAQKAAASDSIAGFAQSPLWGLGRVAAVEHPELRSHLIDLDPRAPMEDSLAALWAEIQSPADEDQVAYRDGGRRVARLQRQRTVSFAICASRQLRFTLFRGLPTRRAAG
jgi:myxalamid-type polyketide synthase MxaB